MPSILKPLQITRRASLLGLTCFWLIGHWTLAADKRESAGEYQVKAAFIFNFIKFTDWPATSFPAAESPIVIGIVGDDPFGNMLDEMVTGEVVHGRPISVKRFRVEDDLRLCQVVFISHSETEHLPTLLSRLKGNPALTISDINGFAQQGGMVSLLVVQKTVKLEINRAVAEEACVQISGKLLNLASIVKSK
jgi:hypothetical protein